jgi:PII-like signaling protein
MESFKAKRVMIFIDEADKFKGSSLANGLIERLRKEGCSGATVLHGSAGFGSHKQVHTSGILDLAANLPVMIMLVDEPDIVDRVLPIVHEMVAEGLIVVDEVEAFRKRR